MSQVNTIRADCLIFGHQSPLLRERTSPVLVVKVSAKVRVLVKDLDGALILVMMLVCSRKSIVEVMMGLKKAFGKVLGTKDELAPMLGILVEMAPWMVPVRGNSLLLLLLGLQLAPWMVSNHGENLTIWLLEWQVAP